MTLPRFVVAIVALALSAASAKAEDKQRIVVAGGALTEIVFALGEGDRVIGVDTTSLYPEAATERAKIGYMRQLSAEGVLSLAPDLLIASADAGPVQALDKLRSAGLSIETAPDADGLDGLYAKIRFLGALLGRQAEAAALSEGLAARVAQIRSEIDATPSRPKVLAILSTRGGGLMAAGAETSALAMIELAGGRNAVAGFDGYKPLSAEAAIAAQPEILIAPEHAVEALGGIDALLARPELAATPAGREKRVLVMDGLLLLGFGPRTPEAIERLAVFLHPEMRSEARSE